MSIDFRDFAPHRKTKVLGMAIGGRQLIHTVVEQAKVWIAANRVAVINMETLILSQAAADQPSHGRHDDTRFNVGMFELSSQRIQDVRAWYRSAA